MDDILKCKIELLQIGDQLRSGNADGTTFPFVEIIEKIDKEYILTRSGRILTYVLKQHINIDVNYNMYFCYRDVHRSIGDVNPTYSAISVKL